MTDAITGTVSDWINLGKPAEEVLPLLDEDLEAEVVTEGGFTWYLEDWSQLTGDKYVSPKFKIGDFEWNILLFPQGNQNRSLAVYLEPHAEERLNEDTGEKELVDPDWFCCAQFAIVLSRPDEDDKVHLINTSHHRFNSVDTDWGFANFIDLAYLKYPAKGRVSGLLNKGRLNVTAYVRIVKDPTGVLWHNFINYDSKKMTGYVGFRNQGATCYLNSLLQSYFFTKYFRKLVYQIPTEGENPNDSVTLALQRAFYQLQVSQFPLDTMELTRSFGWDNAEAFTQHDVQELNRILMDRLETRMKGTSVEGKLGELFVGKMKSYIRCINVDYQSVRTEDFWDIQLNVKNMRDLKTSFENYIEVELMDGENQYAAQGHGLQDAKKGVVFESFPPVLHLQLKRFEYDFNYDQLVKVNDRYEFPDSIDLAPFMDNEALEKNPGPKVYRLHGVLVHTGDISTGHYYTLIKPSTKDEWYRFDDERVWKATRKQVFDDNFGFDRLPDEKIRTMTREQYQDYLIQRHTNAYMLVYIAQEREEELLQPVTEADVPEYVVTKVKQENIERELREKEIREAHLYTNIRINSLKNFIHYQGFDIAPNVRSTLYYSELYSEETLPITLKVSCKSYMKDIYKKVNEQLNIPHGRNVRYWKMGYRRNGTLRLEEPLPLTFEAMTLEESFENENNGKVPSLNIFVEEPYLELGFLQNLKESGAIPSLSINDKLIDDLRNSISSLVSPDNIPTIKDDDNYQVIFLKKFDPSKQSLKGFGYCVVNQLDDLSKLAKTVSDFMRSEPIGQFYEELQPGAIEAVSLKEKFYTAELSSGDILTFQDPEAKLPDIFPVHKDIRAFYEYLRNRTKLVFTKAERPSEEYVVESPTSEKFDFWISSKASYSDVARVVSQQTGIQPEYLKIFAVYANGRFPMKSDSPLSDYIIRDYNSDLKPLFEYEVLSIPLKELEHLRSLKLYWLKDSYIHYHTYEFKVSETCTVREFLDKVQLKIGFSDKEKSNILLWTNCSFQFRGILSENSTLKSVGKSVLLFGRVLPEEVTLVNQLDSLSNSDEVSMGDDDDDDDDNDEEDLGVKGSSPKTILQGCVVMVAQYFKDIENRHGISFLFKLVPNEPFPQTRSRLHEKFGLGQREFSKIHLAISYTTSTGTSFRSLQGYSEEELEKLVLFNVMSNLDCIYMDHPDRLRSQNSHDRPMVIKN